MRDPGTAENPLDEGWEDEELELENSEEDGDLADFDANDDDEEGVEGEDDLDMLEGDDAALLDALHRSVSGSLSSQPMTYLL